MLDPLHFIAPYQAGDSTIVFTDSDGTRLKSINICKYLDNGVKNNILWVILEGGVKLEFDFGNATGATSATIILNAAIDALQGNCGLNGGTPIPPSNTSIIINLQGVVNSYEALVNNNTVVPFQWYDIIDINGALGKGTGQVFRCLPMLNNDASPQGIIITTDEKVIIKIVPFFLCKR